LKNLLESQKTSLETEISNEISNAKASIPNIAFGSYVGTGGTSSFSFSFDFSPKVAIILGGNGESAEITYRSPSEYCFGGMFFAGYPLGNSSSPMAKIVSNGFEVYPSGTPVSITATAENRINSSGLTYYYLVIG
jgi:hypothetical protein